MCFCASFCVEEETKKERFFEAYEKGVRSTKDALHEYIRKKHSQSERLSEEEALVSASRLTPLGNSKKKKGFAR